MSPSLGHTKELAEELIEARDKVNTADRSQRTVLSSLYQTNKKMRMMSHRRSRVKDQLIFTDSKVRALARDVVSIEDKITRQKRLLSRRLAAMYRLSEQTALYILFSADSMSRIDKNLRYLRAYSEQDLGKIHEYLESIAKLNKAKEKMQAEVMHLLSLRKSLARQELALDVEQKKKQKVLSELQKRKSLYLSKMATLKDKAKSDDTVPENLITTFFDKKGQLTLPAVGIIKRGFGYIEDSEHKFKISHKGIFIATEIGDVVRAVHEGEITYVGDVPGYGQTLIIDHGDHFYSVYSYAQRVSVKEGQQVLSGETIARAGKSTLDLEPGVYFEVRHFSDAVDPVEWLDPQLTSTMDKKQL